MTEARTGQMMDENAGGHETQTHGRAEEYWSSDLYHSRLSLVLHAARAGNAGKIMRVASSMPPQARGYAISGALYSLLRCRHLDAARTILAGCKDLASVSNGVMMEAAVLGEADIMQTLLDSGVSLDSSGMSLVSWSATDDDNTECLKLLLEHGAEADDRLATVLAVLGVNGKALGILKEHGAVPRPDKLAAAYVQEESDEGGDELVEDSIWGRNPWRRVFRWLAEDLFADARMAAEKGNAEKAKQLAGVGMEAVRRGGWVEALDRGKHGCSDPVEMRVYKHTERLPFLEEWASSIEDPALEEEERARLGAIVPLLFAGQSIGEAIAAAIHAGVYSVVRMLLNHGCIEQEDMDDGVFTATELGMFDVAEGLISRGALPHGALVTAVWRDRPDVVRFLLAHGADPSRKEGRAFVVAAGKHHPALLRLLLDSGTRPQGNGASRALEEAAASRREDCVLLLLEHGVAAGADGCEALSRAASAGDTTICGILLDAGAEASGQALCQAVLHGNLAIVRMLVEAGADVRYNDDEALFLATREDHHKIADYLVGRGCDVQQTAGHWAAHKRRLF